MRGRRAIRTRHLLDPAKAAPLCNEVMPIGDGKLPIEVIGYRDERGRVRHVIADYPNGWRLSFSLTAARQVTRVSGRIRFVSNAAAGGRA